MPPQTPVIVITGAGGMGLAIARRLGSGSHLVLADFSQVLLDNAAQTLRDDGYQVDVLQTDVSNSSSVQSLAQQTSQFGVVRVVVHTAGLSPVQSPADRIYQVDLIGAALVIDAFLPVATAGTSLVVIASLAGHNIQGKLSADFERHLATARASELLNHPDFGLPASDSTEQELRLRAYSISKRANILRVQTAAAAWGKKGARINSISPGLISTPMGRQELAGPLGDYMREIVLTNPVARVGTPSDIANAVAFLSSPEASFITGTDLLVDGGWRAATRWNA